MRCLLGESRGMPPTSVGVAPAPSSSAGTHRSCGESAVAPIRSDEDGGSTAAATEEANCVMSTRPCLFSMVRQERRIRTTAIGVNFVDIYSRKGVYSAPALPFTPGMEAVGVVTAVGPGLAGRKVGDVVAYAGNPTGSYAEEQILPARVAVPVPPSVDHKVAASVMLKGMTAHMLVRRVFKVESGHTVLVHAAAGGVGSLLCQWSNALGATVIGTVSNEEKAAQATQDGCHHVIIYTKEDVVTRVKEITSGRGVNVVYDSVGKDTYEASVECLASRGFLVSAE